MKKYTFPGGVHPLKSIHEGKRFTQHRPVRVLEPPEIAVLPLSRMVGIPANPIVKAGDYVYKGQKIGEAAGMISATIHASVSGTVMSVEERHHPKAGTAMAVIIKNDHLEAVHPDIKPWGDYQDLSREELVGIIKESGIVGMGGATFPVNVKLNPPPGKTIDTLILNGAECEPFLTSDHRLMIEQPDDIAYGLKTVLKILPDVKQAFVAIENNKPDAIESISKAIEDIDCANVAVLTVKYPQGSEKQLIHAVTGRMVPTGGLPMDTGVVVMNVATVAAIANSLRTGMPNIDRIVTVTGGGIVQPDNLRVRFGDSFAHCIQACGGYAGEVGKIISGGPMMGTAEYTDNVPVISGTSGILVLTKQEVEASEPSNCIRCGRCVAVCPMRLLPLELAKMAENDRFQQACDLGAMDCMECGSCTYICPSRRHIVQSIRLAKNVIRKKRLTPTVKKSQKKQSDKKA